MKIDKKSIIKLTVDEIRDIISQHMLEKHNISINHIHFIVKGHQMDGDWMSQYPLNYTLDAAECTGVENVLLD